MYLLDRHGHLVARSPISLKGFNLMQPHLDDAVCPHCRSGSVLERHAGERAFAAAGLLVGAVSGASSAWRGAHAGSQLGAVAGAWAGPAGTTLGAAVGAVLGGMAGSAVGCKAGARLGAVADAHLLDNRACMNCKRTFHDTTSTDFDTS